MVEGTQATTEDTSTPDPQEPTVQLVDVDNQGEPEGGSQETTAAPEPQGEQLLAGKFKSPEDLANAYQEVERLAHERSEEAATYRKIIEQQQPQTTPAPQPVPDQAALNEKFRAQLAEDPWGTLTNFVKFNVQQGQQQQTAQQQERMNEVNHYASQPEFKDVANEAVSMLTYGQEQDVEKAFLRAKIANMGKAQSQPTQAPLAPGMHVESGSSRQSDNTLNIQLDPDANRVRNAFGMDEKQWVDLNKRTAQMKQATQGTARPQVSIEQWRAMQGGKK